MAVDRLPKRQTEPPRTKFRSAAGDPEAAAISADWNATVCRLIDALPEDLRQPLALSALDEMTSHQIGAVMGIAEGTVRTRLMRARQILKQKLAAIGVRSPWIVTIATNWTGSSIAVSPGYAAARTIGGTRRARPQSRSAGECRPAARPIGNWALAVPLIAASIVGWSSRGAAAGLPADRTPGRRVAHVENALAPPPGRHTGRHPASESAMTYKSGAAEDETKFPTPTPLTPGGARVNRRRAASAGGVGPLAVAESGRDPDRTD